MRIQWSDLKTFDIIGSGSFGRVFHGELLGTEVAIKECVRSNSKAFDEKYFKREVDILRQSRHPNIVQFMGICKRKKRFYIVTEFLPMGNLRRWIQDESKEFGWDTRISFAIDISLALAYLHHKNIIHRDLKGENLLISENMRVKVCDFGFSRLAARDDDEMRRISYCGTDGYMAPEILLGEDFDCSVDVFSFGVVLTEMMARHVVDPQHFQRHAPDMRVSPEEIIFRAQPGCPAELGELAIHCVEPLPQHRPNLRDIVERLTAIESVDIHVGTTLVVAPSVARAARNMERKREAAIRNLQEQQGFYMHGNAGLYPGGQQPQATSSIQAEAESCRMTDGGNSSLRTTSSHLAGSQSTFRGRQWKRDGSQDQTESSAIPLVLVERRRERDQNRTDDDHTLSRVSGSERSDEDENGLRMPRWDSINSPENLEQLRQWHMSNPAGDDGADEDGSLRSLRSWDGERQQSESGHNSSRLGSIQLFLNDRDDDGDNISFDGGDSSDEDLDSLFGESDFGPESSILGQGQAGGADYELSSDSDESLSSLTESVVRALDTLEIPDLEMATLHGPALALATPPDHELLSIREAMDTAVGTSIYAQGDEDDTKEFKKPRLISRLLPPIPTSENPWTSFQTLEGNTGPATERNGHGTEADNQSPGGTLRSAPVVHLVSVQRTDDSAAATKDLEVTQESSIPPEPPSKSSLLLRVYSIKSNRSPPQTTDKASPVDTEPISPKAGDPVNDQPDVATPPSTSSTTDSTSTSTASSEKSALTVSSSSSAESNVETKGDSQTGITKDNTTNGTPLPRGPGLVRGMSDSLLESTSTAAATEPGNTITANLIAAMGARTWTSGTGGFGHWISQYRHQGDQMDKTGLKKHTSLKEGKQQRQLVQGLSALNGFVPEESDEIVEGPEPALKPKEEDQVEPVAVVKRRAPKPLTGFPHRFSLVVFSTQLLPKCDVCLKRLGVLPGWSAKHLECDDCGYRTHPKCAANVTKCCTSARKSGVWDLPA
ncbi:hypothetical protein BGX31_005346 [Mortierella sp. GBA43]|nr:hypothetical protein BGX31_005346 [Mortierella sp. GBA43]